MRQCRIASCCKLAHHPCCKDCKDRTCAVRCQNSPDRCGCWEDSARRSHAGQFIESEKRSRKSKVDRQELLRLHNQGLLQREIAQRVGCSTSMVSAVLCEMGVRRYG